MKQNYFHTDKAVLLSDQDYYIYLLDKIDHAQKYIYASVFIINILEDKEKKIRILLDKLKYAKWRGVDVKLIIGHSQKNLLIDLYDRMCFEYLKDAVPIKYARPDDDYSLHSKYVVIDDKISIAGSHNWEHKAFFENKEDSVATFSRDVALEFKHEFNKLWKTGLEEL
jgi:phosphatidylserine/phosphatidylglycerophosphate/cardiolipin synthase-like enzyme